MQKQLFASKIIRSLIVNKIFWLNFKLKIIIINYIPINTTCIFWSWKTIFFFSFNAITIILEWIKLRSFFFYEAIIFLVNDKDIKTSFCFLVSKINITCIIWIFNLFFNIFNAKVVSKTFGSDRWHTQYIIRRFMLLKPLEFTLNQLKAYSLIFHFKILYFLS